MHYFSLKSIYGSSLTIMRPLSFRIAQHLLSIFLSSFLHTQMISSLLPSRQKIQFGKIADKHCFSSALAKQYLDPPSSGHLNLLWYLLLNLVSGSRLNMSYTDQHSQFCQYKLSSNKLLSVTSYTNSTK